ncbi:MAG: hypothetical protein ACOX37_05025 [Bacillota bacterium]
MFYPGGRVHRLPEGLMLMVPTKIIPFAFSPLISWPGKLRMGLDLILPRRRGKGDESLAGFVTRRLGREALDKIAEPLIGGIHAGDPEEMSLAGKLSPFSPRWNRSTGASSGPCWPPGSGRKKIRDRGGRESSDHLFHVFSTGVGTADRENWPGVWLRKRYGWTAGWRR